MIPTLENAYFAKKKVLLRAGFDVPLDASGNITDDTRIRVSLPTIKYLLDHGALQIVIMTHIGRPKNNEPNLKTDNVAKRLGEILGQKVLKVNDWGESGIPKPEECRVVLLENLRFNPGEKEKDPIKRDAFGKNLASLADVYVNDAFSNCHREHASMTSVPKFIPGCVGLSVGKEVSTIKTAMENPKRPFISIIGGVKADKLNAVSNLLDKVDKILIAGALAFTLLKEFGKEVGKTKTDSEGLSEFKDLIGKIKGNPKVVLPIDAVLGTEFSNNSDSSIASVDNIDKDRMALDIGPETVKLFKREIESAKTIIWNGPVGAFEFEKFAGGTKEVAAAMANNSGTKIVGGGDSGAAVEKLGLKDKMTLVSSGGGVSLQMFEGKDLPAIKALEIEESKEE